jgi:hypothetical protein
MEYMKTISLIQYTYHGSHMEHNIDADLHDKISRLHLWFLSEYVW